jgi:hypothetical protein
MPQLTGHIDTKRTIADSTTYLRSIRNRANRPTSHLHSHTHTHIHREVTQSGEEATIATQTMTAVAPFRMILEP